MGRTPRGLALVCALALSACSGGAVAPETGQFSNAGGPSGTEAGGPGGTEAGGPGGTEAGGPGGTEAGGPGGSNAASAPSAPTTDAPAPAVVEELQIELPTGQILAAADDDDAFVVTPGGVLYWHPDLFAETPGEPVQVVGTAADNDVERVAGLVGGAVILGLCCAEPRGQVSATTGESASALTGGSRPALSRDGTALASVGDRDIAVIDLVSGTGRAVEIADGDTLVPLDVIWSSDSPIVLAAEGAELVLAFLNPETLALGRLVPTGLGYDEEAYAEFAGYGPSGEVAVVHAAGTDTAVSLQAYSADTLRPVDTLTRTLPTGVRSVRVRSAGDVVWIDQGTVWRTVGGESEPLGAGATAVWFAVE